MEPDEVQLSNVDKVFFPAAGLSEGDVIAHYRGVAEKMVPHLAGRPLTMRRYPDGIDGGGFFQKDASGRFPDRLRIEELPQRRGGTIHHVVCDDAATWCTSPTRRPSSSTSGCPPWTTWSTRTAW